MKNFDLKRLVEEIQVIAPQNGIIITATGFILNNVPVTIKDNFVTFRSTKFRFSNIADLLTTLRFEGLFHATTEDIYILTTKQIAINNEETTKNAKC